MMLFGNAWNNIGHDTKPATMALCKQIDLKLYLGYTESYPKARMELCKQIDFKRKSIFMKSPTWEQNSQNLNSKAKVD